MAAFALGTLLLPLPADAPGTGQPSAEPGDPREADADWGTRIDWAYWKDVNPDVVGWVRIPGTRIDYPVVQATAADPRRYLDHDVFGNWNPRGCPYVDAECSLEEPSAHIVISAHNMLDGSMFAALASYGDTPFAQAHQRVEIATPERSFDLEVLGVRIVDSEREAKATSFGNAAAFERYRSECLGSCNIELPAMGKLRTSPLFTFCTCSYAIWPGHERTLVYAQPA